MSNIPRPEQILEWVNTHPDLTSSKDIARAFGVKGKNKTALKAMLREMKRQGEIKKRKAHYEMREGAYEVARVSDIADGTIYVVPQRHPEESLLLVDAGLRLAIGDQLLIRLEKTQSPKPLWQARLVRRVEKQASTVIARFEDNRDGGQAVSLDKGRQMRWRIIRQKALSPETGDVIEIEPVNQKGAREARLVRILGAETSPRILSQLSIEAHDLPVAFTERLEAAAKNAVPADVSRQDLSALPFVTIDPADARDHDDAVYAEPDGAGWQLYVAIADVAAYVTPRSALDNEARLRGNSVYFPDQVVPMLPETLSNGACSLHEGEARNVMVAQMRIDANGHKVSHKFYRAVLRSHASLSYETAQAIADSTGPVDGVTMQVTSAVTDLFALYKALRHATDMRAPLHLDLPERRIKLSGDGQIVDIGFRERLDAHRLIEEMMVLANVAAAEAIEAKHSHLLYRVHDAPKPEKIDVLKTIAKAAGLSFKTQGELSTKTLNQLLDGATGHNDAELINHSVLRTLTQAYYGPENGGHFGLNLKRYAHFTSPIRRYADIIVHRALISAYKLGPDGLSDADIAALAETGKAISQAERRAMQAERETEDRYVARYLESHGTAEFSGRIAGLAKFGVFVRLDGLGADGFVPLSAIGNDHYRYDKARDQFRGVRTGQVIRLGQKVQVKLKEVNALSGGIELDILAIEGQEIAASQRPVRGKGGLKSRPQGKRKSRRFSR